MAYGISGATRTKADYFKMEKKFLNFCNNINLSAAKVDAVIWRTMKTLNSIVLKELEKQELIQN
jgi:thermostable 8-oxoguanine DNA glycosylase